MVRVKTKARRGDDSFQTRKQKVGRRKLAPATATRAEVHARTLKVTNPAALSRTTLDVTGDAGKKEARGRRKQEDFAAFMEKVHRDFKEYISNTRHYKKVMRGSAFTSLARAITLNRELTERGVQSTNCASGFGGAADDAALSPLEVLSAFASALDAMSDTDDDVRRSAFSTIRVILNSRSLPGGHTGETSGVVLDRFFFMADCGASCDMDRTRAVLQVVDVTLTHAMSSVRRSGAELLHLILQVSPRGVRTVLGASDAWVRMASRVSSILLQGGSVGGGNSGSVSSTASSGTVSLIHVLPELLETMLMRGYESTLVDCVYCNQQQQTKPAEEGVVDEAKVGERVDVAPARIVEFFDECAPKWGMEWKEIMEMRSAIFRDFERVQRAIAIARAFACVTTYMREHGLLLKTHKQLICHLFTVKMPFTMRELCGSLDSSGGGRRVALANAIAEACMPVADFADEAFRLVRDFFLVAFGGVNRTSSPPPAPPLAETNVGGSSARIATQLLGPLRTLRMALLRFSDAFILRLLFVVPPLLQVATRIVGGADCSAWAPVSLLVADVFFLVLRSRTAVGSPHGLQCLRAAVLAVPRLLFALRGKTDGATVDRVVFAFLWPLWHAVSSGHPLMRPHLLSLSCSNNYGAKRTGPFDIADDVTAQLRMLLPSLFEVRLGCGERPETMEGVLSRCTHRTEELAAHLFFYLRAELPHRAGASSAYPLLVNTLPGFC